jgi:erythromycin esterase-like protein
MVGETHGTRETPDFFADLVCLASTKRRVIVAVEQDTAGQPAIDAFMRSRGDLAAREAFVQAIWPTGLDDGRGSEAMVDLFDRLRQYQQSGRVQRVVAFRGSLTED